MCSIDIMRQPVMCHTLGHAGAECAAPLPGHSYRVLHRASSSHVCVVRWCSSQLLCCYDSPDTMTTLAPPLYKGVATSWPAGCWPSPRCIIWADSLHWLHQAAAQPRIKGPSVRHQRPVSSTICVKKLSVATCTGTPCQRCSTGCGL